MNKLKHEELKSILDYDSINGIFTNRVTRNSRAIEGAQAGTINGKGAIQIRINGKIYFAHRLAWFFIHGSWPMNKIDHIDGNPQNNAISNLREATVSQNNCNRKPYKQKSVASKGVYLKGKRFVAQIKINRVHHYLGLFDTEEEASKAYHNAAKKLHGDFARFK